MLNRNERFVITKSSTYGESVGRRVGSWVGVKVGILVLSKEIEV